MSDTLIASLEEQLGYASDEVERIRLMNELAHQIRFKDSARALDLAREAFDLAERIGDTGSSVLSLIHIADCQRQFSNFTAAFETLEQAWNMLSLVPENLELAALYHTSIGILKGYHDGKEELKHYDIALKIYTAANNRPRMATILCYQGQTQILLRNPVVALDLLRQALEIAEELNDTNLIALTTQSIGVVYRSVGDGAQSIHYLRRSLNATLDSGKVLRIAQLYDQLGDAYRFVIDLDSSIEHYKISLKLFREVQVPSGVAQALHAIGGSYGEKGEYDKAMEYLTEALRVAEAVEEQYLIDLMLTGIGLTHWLRGEFVDALGYLERVASDEYERQHWRLSYSSYRALASIHEHLGNTSEALHYYKRWAEIREEMQGRQRIEALESLEWRLQIERHEREREVYRLKSEQLEREMVRDRRELESLAEKLSQKNAVMVSLEEKIRELELASGSSAAPMSSQVRRAWGESQDWEEFSERFTAVYPEFMRNLASRYPDLTAMERKVSALMRMDLATKEIANILYTSVRTVEGHRRFIRRKLGLGRDANLSTFLASLG